jgi:hypothetical protein
MKKILVAITYHNQARATIHKSFTSALQGFGKNWNGSVVIFCNDKKPVDIEQVSVITHRESLGGKRNFAIDYARANNFDLITFLDDDDLFGPSWLPGLFYAAEKNERGIFHPQWNVLFGPDWFKLHEHIGSNDPRFDSRDCLLNNPWSALCAFNPFIMNVRYNEHLITDKRLSFEDWSFNLDTYCDGYEHIAVKDTFHFLRMRENSLGKSTHRCAPAHTSFFLNSETRNIHPATEDYLQDKYLIANDVFIPEMKAIHEIEPQIYYWGQEKTEQEHYGRCQKVSTAIDLLGDFRGISDVFWTVDHYRHGGAEKAIHFTKTFLSRFPLGKTPGQLWIDDIVAAKNELEVKEWSAAIRNVLRAWHDDPASKSRSLHICNSFMAWQTITFNPELFDKIEVYFYVFNDDLRFQSLDFPETRGFHSPLYRFANMIDRPNFHIITDSHHFANRIEEKTGLMSLVRVIDIPVVNQYSRRKKSPTEMVDILWAGRLDDFKGIGLLCETAELLDPKKFSITVFGDGQDKYKKMLSACRGPLFYAGPYKSFEYIEGEYDFFLFTSEREGMPNVVKEATAAELNTLACFDNWVNEFNVKIVFRGHGGEELAKLITEKSDILSGPCPKTSLDFNACAPSAMKAFKECITLERN